MYKKMDKRYFILIPLLALIATGMLSGDVYSIGGHFKNQSGIGGTVYDCNKCHDFVTGIYGGGDPYGTPTPPALPPPGENLRWVKRTFEFCSTSTNIACDVNSDCPEGETCVPNPTIVEFTKFSQSLPADGTLADGNSSDVDGACEICHTATTYHNKYGTGASHYPANNCTACHPHFTEDFANYFAPTFVGGQSHFTHFNDPKGPMLGTNNCTYCHSTYDFHIFADGKPLVPEPGYPQGTAKCDPCHGKNGPFDGVNDPVIGAKPNWESAIYEEPSNPSNWPSEIKQGKENWCAGCHDTKYDDSYDSRIYNVTAPNVMGNNVAYGNNVTGHGARGVTCSGVLGCHNATATHTDGEPRTYSAPLNNYQSGYRLSMNMAIPRHNQIGLTAFALCFYCHNYSKIFGTESAFRDDNRDLHFHEAHLDQAFKDRYSWDSDWSGGTCPSLSEPAPDGGCDSAVSCTACHNVHGSPCIIGSSIVTCSNPLKTPMIRHGELISSPGTQNKVPALEFHWYTDNNTPTTNFDQSRWAGLLCSNTDLSFNNICVGCHFYDAEIRYYRGPCGPKKVTVLGVWTTDTDPGNTPKTDFYPGDPIRYHVSFTITGTGTEYFVQAHGVAQKADGTGPKHDFTKYDYDVAPCNTYEWTEDRILPVFTPPPEGVTARITFQVGMYDYYGGPLLSWGQNSSLFYVVRPSP